MARDQRDGDQIDVSFDPAKMKPTGNNVIVKLDPLPEKTESGLYLAVDSRAHEHRTGTVMAVGPGKVAPKTGARCPMALKPGDKVIIGRYVGAEFIFEGQAYQVMPEEQIYCSVEL